MKPARLSQVHVEEGYRTPTSSLESWSCTQHTHWVTKDTLVIITAVGIQVGTTLTLNDTPQKDLMDTYTDSDLTQVMGEMPPRPVLLQWQHPLEPK